MATDDDEMDTQNSNVTFALANSSLPFTIDPILGVVSVSDSLTVQEYEIVVVASDNGAPSLSSTGSFFVDVVPPNFFSPGFPSTLVGEFTENEVQSAPVATFIVSDADLGAEGRANVTLLPSEFSSSFTLTFDNTTDSQTTATIFVLSPFDREATPIITLSLQAVDTGHRLFRLTSTAEINITVLDANDQAPEFVGAPYEANVPEDATGGIVFFQAFATDEDIGTNAAVAFSLGEGSDFDGTFEIDGPSGNLSVVGTLLRSQRSFYQLTLVVTNDLTSNELSSNTTLNVTIIEVNDNAPQFEPPLPSTIVVSEDIPRSYLFINITVTDADTGVAGEVELQLEQSGDIFALDGNNLVLENLVDFEVSCIYSSSYRLCKLHTA